MKKNIIIYSFVIVVVFILIVIFGYIFINQENNQNNNGVDNNLTTSYTNITVQEAYNKLYINNENIIIIDVPSLGITRYNESHLENAIMIDDQIKLPEGIEGLFYTDKDVLIYDDDGRGTGIYYCKKLINKFYGEIYYLSGGFTEWKNNDYPYWSWNQ